MNKSKTKDLFSLTKDFIQIVDRITVSIVSGKINIYYTIRSVKKKNNYMYFKPLNKPVKTNLQKVPKGRVRHHIAYHFNDSDKGTVVIDRGFHLKIHGVGNHERLCLE